MIETIKMSEEQAGILRRSHKLVNTDIAKTTRKLIWQAIRKENGLPATLKFRAQIDDPTGLNYLVLCDKATGQPFGKAVSGMPYGRVPIANAIPFMNTTWDERAVLPFGAVLVGHGLFAKDGYLYFPAI